MQTKQWRDLSAAQRRTILLAGILQMMLLGAALFDIRKRSHAEINGSKRLWTAALFINYVGPIAYFLFGRKR